MPTYTDFTIKFTISQPALIINGVEIEAVSQEAIIAFGRWFKGDKGDKGDPAPFDYDIATNEDIDDLF